VHCDNFIKYKTQFIDKIKTSSQAQLKYPADFLFEKMELDCMKYKLETIYSDERKEEDSKENLEKAIAEYLEQATSLKERYTKCS